jgi:hypothetical protein
MELLEAPFDALPFANDEKLYSVFRLDLAGSLRFLATVFGSFPCAQRMENSCAWKVNGFTHPTFRPPVQNRKNAKSSYPPLKTD